MDFINTKKNDHDREQKEKSMAIYKALLRESWTFE